MIRASRGVAGAALVGAVALAALGLVLATRTSFFYADDYQNFALALQYGFSISFLKLSVIGGELAPGHRFLDWLVGAHIGLHWGAAIAIMMLFWAGAVIAFERVAEELFESRWLVAITTALFASSPAWVRVIQWWANGEHVMPSIFWTLVALAASLRWLRTRSHVALLLAALAYGAALMFYAKPVLLPLYVVLLAYLTPSRLGSPGISRSRLREDLPLVFVLLGITVAYAIVVSLGGYLGLTKAAGPGAWLHFFGLDWFAGVTPWMIGQSSIPSFAGVSPLVDAFAELVLTLVVVAAAARSRSAWRAWTFYVIAWTANTVLVGRSRLGLYGPGMGYDPRYNAELAFLLPLAIGLAFSAPKGPELLYRRVRPRLAGRLPRRGLPIVSAVAAAAFAGSLAVAYQRLSSAWPAGQARPWVDHVRESIASLRRRGIQPSVVDAVVPYRVVAGAALPFGLLSRVLPEVDRRIMIDESTGRDPPAVVKPDGTITLATVHELVGGPAATLLRARILTPPGGTAKMAFRGGRFCPSARQAPLPMEFRPGAPVALRDGVLEVRLSGRKVHGALFVYFNTGSGYPGQPSRTFWLRPQDRVLRAEVLADRLVTARLDLQPESSVCLRTLAIAEYSA